MDQRPDPSHGSPETQDARIEEDFIGPLTPMKNMSHPRLPAALPFALAGVLVVSGLAFGAQFVKPSSGDHANPTLGQAGHERTHATQTATATLDESEPTAEEPVETATETATTIATPTATPTAARTAKPTTKPTASPARGLTLSAAVVSGKVKLTWSAYTGSDFAYYKVVRSSDATVAWPLGYDDTLLQAIGSKTQTSVTVSAPAGKTYSYRVFAVKSSDEGYAVLLASNVRTLATPAATEPVTDTPIDLGAITATRNSSCYTLTWNAYDGPIDFSYYKLSGTTGSGPFGYVEGTGYWAVLNPGTVSWTGAIKPGSWRIKVEAVYYPDGAAKAAETQILTLQVAVPEPTPAPAAMDLAVALADGKPSLTWSRFDGDGFQSYAIVRSETNSNPVYPMTAGATTVRKTISSQDTVTWTDSDVVAGHTYYYRVQALVGGDCGTSLGAVSPVRSASIPDAAPTEVPAT